MRFFTSLILLLFVGSVSAQLPRYFEEDRSNEGKVFLIQLNYGGNISAGDLADRFGGHFHTGGKLELLTAKDYIIGAQSYFMFGSNIKEDVIATLYNSDGFIFGENGSVAELQLRQRGLYVGGNIGKIFRINESQRSGIRATIGAGLYQHKVRIQDDPLVFVPFLNDEYKRGYDRLSNGFALSQFIGYQHLGRKRRLNFMIGVEVIEAFTQSRRSFDYDLRASDTASRLDISIGFQLGWTLPMYIGENADAIQY